MPPRFAYWTILIDETPTAFRANRRDDLLPTLRQLRHANKNVELKWFANGRLWDTPDAARLHRRPTDEPRGKDWRPGGDHRDPRSRPDRRKQGGDRQKQARGPQSPGAPGGEPASRDRPRRDSGRVGGHQGGWHGSPKSGAAQSRRPPDKPWHDKPWKKTATPDRWRPRTPDRTNQRAPHKPHTGRSGDPRPARAGAPYPPGTAQRTDARTPAQRPWDRRPKSGRENRPWNKPQERQRDVRPHTSHPQGSSSRERSDPSHRKPFPKRPLPKGPLVGQRAPGVLNPSPTPGVLNRSPSGVSPQEAARKPRRWPLPVDGAATGNDAATAIDGKKSREPKKKG